jgi:succinate dehydrogenase / fumarate reductase cytochrome b subunit
MGILGTFIFIFLVIHLANFWARAKLGIGDQVPNDPYGNKDLYSLAAVLFDNLYYTIFYSLMMIPLGYHLVHGVKSAFKSLGVYHKKGLKIIEKASLLFALIIPFGFGIIPFIMYFN